MLLRKPGRGGRSAVRRRAGVFHPHATPRPDDLAAVADLTAGLSVERRLLQDDLHRLTLGGAFDLGAAGNEANDRGLGGERLVAQERDLQRGQWAVGVGGALLRRTWRRRELARVLLHQLLEASLIDREAAVAGDLAAELHGEAVGVMEEEDVLAGDLLQLGRFACSMTSFSRSSPRLSVSSKRSSSGWMMRSANSLRARSSG